MDIIKNPKIYSNPLKLLNLLKTKPEKYWIKRGEKRALTLFHMMADRVPAYKDFLKKSKISPKNIKSISDFKKVPTIDKDNYLRKYSIEKLCWDGKFKEKSWTIAATSGSSGEPFYFPRNKLQDLQYATTAELYLLNNFNIDKQSTLYINGFGMGIWIGGVFTYQAIKYVAENKKYNLSIITPGTSKEEIIKSVREFGNKFDQIIIGGYPPFIKDMIDDGTLGGIKWNDYNIKFVFSAEGFTEEFRDYIASKIGLKNTFTDTLNHYGTVDLGTMAHETPLSILTRRIINKNSLMDIFFHRGNKSPTLVQYLPEMFYFEEDENSLLCSAFSGLPLIRYDLKDNGGIFSLEQITNKLDQNNIQFKKLIDKNGLSEKVWNLPFIFIFERNDFTVKLSGANIYPEEIKKALLNKDFSSYITGKFTMTVNADERLNQKLHIYIETRKGKKINDELHETILSKIIKQLLNDNSEYRYLYTHFNKERLIPKIYFLSYEDPTYFNPGGKQKWVKKTT